VVSVRQDPRGLRTPAFAWLPSFLHGLLLMPALAALCAVIAGCDDFPLQKPCFRNWYHHYTSLLFA
jgi:hypothetical protein